MKTLRKHYHVFTDNKDEYTDTIKEAKEVIKEWRKEHSDNNTFNWRIALAGEYWEDGEPTGDFAIEETLYGARDWPQ